MSSDWEEIRRLAADFQRAQSLSTAQRLSERNCVEIVNTLVEQKLVTVFHTCDGKEYVTPEQVVREIRDELLLNNGRISVHELCHLLNLDFSCIELCVKQLISEDRNVRHVCDYVIDHTYMDNVAAEIGDKLQQVGTVDLDHVTCQYDLEADFFKRELLSRLSSDIYREPDESGSIILFTEAFVARHRAKIVGALSALTQPTSVLKLLQRHAIKERLFFHVASELLSAGRVRGSLTGGKQSARAVFVPECHTANQNAHVDHMYKKDNCIELDALRRIGISDPEAFVRRRFKREELVFLPSFVIGPTLVNQIQASVEQAVLDETCIDILHLLPVSFVPAEAVQLLDSCCQQLVLVKGAGDGYLCLAESVVVSQALLTKLLTALSENMEERAAKDIAAGLYTTKSSSTAVPVSGDGDDDGQATIVSRKEERRRRAAGGKSGGGTQGRETRTRSTKKKYMKRSGAAGGDSEDETTDMKSSSTCVFMTHEQLVASINQLDMIEDPTEELVSDIARHLYGGLQSQYDEVLRRVHGSVMAVTSQRRRRNFAEFQDNVTTLVHNIKLFEKAANEFSGDVRVQLLRHLLRTTCAELVTELCVYCFAENGVNVEAGKDLSTADARGRYLCQLPADLSQPLTLLNKSLSGHDTLDLFRQHLDPVLSLCHLHVLKLERKRERAQSQQHVQQLTDQLRNVESEFNSGGPSHDQPALYLHLATLLLFHAHTGHVLNASGKFVPAILARLKSCMSAEDYTVLQQFQELVVQQFRLAADDPQRADFTQKLLQLAPSVGRLVKTAGVSSTPTESQKEQQETAD